MVNGMIHLIELIELKIKFLINNEINLLILLNLYIYMLELKKIFAHYLINYNKMLKENLFKIIKIIL